MSIKEKIIIVGGGPSGLFCADRLLEKGYAVDLYDHQSGLGKKFLVAGNGGLNLTHSEDLSFFVKKYGKDEAIFNLLLESFSPDDLRSWCAQIGVETFVGSSGRVFPVKMKAADILLKWISKLKSNHNFKLFLKHKVTSIDKNKNISFLHEGRLIKSQADVVILALGGASWKKTGSDGNWINIFSGSDIKIHKFRPMNCGFETCWSDFFIKNVRRHPLKNIELSMGNKKIRTEIMITDFGLEGTGIYALSNLIRNKINENSSAVITLDLLPDYSSCEILEKLNKRDSKTSLSNFLRKKFGIKKVEYTLIRELISNESIINNVELSEKIKRIEIKLNRARPIDEAISTSGGICFSEVTKNMELIKLPGVFVAGEMLDFEAPTGGYLLQGCFSSSYAVVNGIINSSQN